MSGTDAPATFVALLRAVNVGGTGRLPMADLVRLCEGLGFESVTTYIQSGNVVFSSSAPPDEVRAMLEAALASHLGAAVDVLLRSPAELERVLTRNPFPQAPPERVVVTFLDSAPSAAVLTEVAAPGGEELALLGRELYVHYPGGQGRSKLRLPFARTGTGRNLNTVRKLAAMAAELERRSG